MKRLIFWGLTGLLATSSSLAASMTYYAIEVRGGSKVYSVDKPVRKGRVLVFHRYPDGVYLSLPASEVEKVSTVQSQAEPEPAPAEALAPGSTVYVGPALHGPAYEAPPSAPSFADTTYVDSSYGDYGDYYWGGGYVPPRPPSPAPPSRIGPNGYPILAPPGTAGSVPPPIGSNGYPILAPPPAVPAPRRR
jgi:hypothetical protein